MSVVCSLTVTREAVRNIIAMFEDCGYDVSPTLVNAKDYGVAQERKRVFYIGFQKDLHIEFKFPEGSTADNDKKSHYGILYGICKRQPFLPHHINKHNPKAINNNEYFTGAFSPIFMSRNRVKRGMNRLLPFGHQGVNASFIRKHQR